MESNPFSKVSSKLKDAINTLKRQEEQIHEDVARKLVGVFGFDAKYEKDVYEHIGATDYLVNNIVVATVKRVVPDAFSGKNSLTYEVRVLPDKVLYDLKKEFDNVRTNT